MTLPGNPEHLPPEDQQFYMCRTLAPPQHIRLNTTMEAHK